MNARPPRLSPLHRRDYEEKGATMKVRNSLRSLKGRPGAQLVRRRGKVYVINRKDPRGKARQG